MFRRAFAYANGEENDTVSITATRANPIDVLTVGFDFTQLTYRTLVLSPAPSSPLPLPCSSHLSSLKVAVRRGYQRKSCFNET